MIEYHMILAPPHVLGQAARRIQINFSAGLVQLTVYVRAARRGWRGSIRRKEQGLLIGRTLLGAQDVLPMSVQVTFRSSERVRRRFAHHGGRDGQRAQQAVAECAEQRGHRR